MPFLFPLSSLDWMLCFAFRINSNKYNSLCCLAFSGMGWDKIHPPHQVRSTQSRPGLSAGSALQVEQGRSSPSMLWSRRYCRRYQQCRHYRQTLDLEILRIALHGFSFQTLLTNGANPSLLLSEKMNASEVALQPPLDSEKPKVHKIKKEKLSYILSRLL